MKEKPYSPALREQRERLDQTNDTLALRALTLRIFEADWKDTDLESLLVDLNFPPISLANALIKLATLEIIRIEQGRVAKAHGAERKILASRSKLIRVFGKTAWKTNDLRETEKFRFVINKN
jgi:hypothetical protein